MSFRPVFRSPSRRSGTLFEASACAVQASKNGALSFPPGTVGEINKVFATLQRPDALFVAADAVFTGRRVQLVTLAAIDRIPATYPNRDYVEVGGLMSYGPDFADMFRQVGAYTGSILKGTKPADLPVLQSTKLELVINVTTAQALGVTIPAGVFSIADEVIE